MPMFILRLMPWFVLHIYYLGAYLTTQTVYVSEGKSAVLKCQVDNKSYFRWYGPGGKFGSSVYTRGLKIALELSNKLKLVGNITNGEYNMEIYNVTEKDVGKYECFYRHIKNKTFHLTVVTLILQIKPTNLTIHGMVDGSLLGQEGKSLKLHCSVISGIPKDTLTWYNMSSAIGTGGPEILNITIKPTRYDHKKTYTCRISSDSLHGQELLQERVTLEIQTKPIFIAATENIQYGRIGAQINISVSVYCYPDFSSLNIFTGDFCCFNKTKYQQVTDYNISGQMKGYTISLQGLTLTEKDFTTYNFWIQNEIGDETFRVILIPRDYKFKFQSEYGPGWLLMGCIVGGIVIFSICSNIYCYWTRKKLANVMLESSPEEHYEEIGTINYNNVPFEPTVDVTLEHDTHMSIIAGDSDNMLRVGSERSEDSSLGGLTGITQSGDGYENPYQSINLENIEMHPYSIIASNNYHSTIIFPTSAGTKNIKRSNIAEETSKNPWLIIYNKKE